MCGWRFFENLWIPIIHLNFHYLFNYSIGCDNQTQEFIERFQLGGCPVQVLILV